MPSASTVRRGYVDVPFGQVHYRVSGLGPPVVLLHDSPRSSAMHEALLDWLGDAFTAIALDTPGYGASSPLPADPRPEITDFAAALAVTLDALGVPPCPVYGFHTSSKIALQLAVDHPGRATVAILDGLSLPPGPPDEEVIAAYMAPFTTRADGSYLVTQWTKIRDLHRFFPWFRREQAARLSLELPDERHLHEYGVDLLMAGPNFASAYAAAMRYPALSAVSRLRSPAVFMARSDDVLYRYLDDLPAPLPPDCSLERLGPDRDAWRDRLRALFREHSTADPPAFRPPDPLTGGTGDSAAGYVERAHGQVHVRRYGRPGATPVLYVPETPGGGSAHVAFARALAVGREVFLVDPPGSGGSDPLPTPDAGGYADALRDVATALRLQQFDVVADFTATPLAIELARQAPDRVRRLVLDAVPLLTAHERRELWRNYCPKLAPRWDGTHLVSLFHRFRDQELSWPWFDRRPQAIRQREPRLDADHLHRQVLDAARQIEHYGDAANAALDYPVKDRLAEVRQRVLLPTVAGDPRYQWTEKVRRALAGAIVAPRADGDAPRAAACLAFLDAS
jgi:pimeloyl-ACP methyl ester carboxylesterase